MKLDFSAKRLQTATIDEVRAGMWAYIVIQLRLNKEDYEDFIHELNGLSGKDLYSMTREQMSSRFKQAEMIILDGFRMGFKDGSVNGEDNERAGVLFFILLGSMWPFMFFGLMYYVDALGMRKEWALDLPRYSR